MGYLVLRKVTKNLNKSSLTIPTDSYELDIPVISAVDEFGYGDHAIVNVKGEIIGKLELHISNPIPYSRTKR